MAAKRISRKKWISRMLVCAMVLCLLPSRGSAADRGVTASVTIGTGIADTPSAAVDVQWDDRWFAEDAAAYRHELAEAAMALSGAAYVKTGQKAGAQNALEAFGFSRVKAYNYHLSLESAGQTAYVFGVKTVKDRRGGTARLVAVIIRGTGEYTEWAGNLNIGSGDDHEGFAEARDELLENLTEYLANTGGKTGDTVKFLVTGHSRGGAVANMTAAYLVDAKLAKKENVYGYTFAAPAVSVKAKEEGYESIFNIVNGEDLVTQVPLSAWGYRRYGVDLLLPGRESAGEAYDGIYEKMNRRYMELTGQQYTGFQDAAATEKMTSALQRLLPKASGVNMAIVSGILRGDMSGVAELVRQNSIASFLLGRTAVQVTSELVPLIQQEQGGLTSAHCMAGYYSWLTAMEET